MIEHIVLGLIQGIAEWLPVSSEGMLVLAKTHFFNDGQPLLSVIKMALFLHLGTFLAALIYFRKDVSTLLTAIPKLKTASEEHRKLFMFLLISTVISGALGYGLIKTVAHMADSAEATGKTVTVLVGLLLLGTGFLELRAKKGGIRKIHNLNLVDSVTLGLIQGLAALPGFSRSGLTVSALLLRKIDKAQALRLSFLMSLPIVLAGNIILNFNEMTYSIEGLIGLIFAFISGLLTIHGLLKVAKIINFGYFVLAFGGLTLLSALI